MFSLFDWGPVRGTGMSTMVFGPMHSRMLSFDSRNAYNIYLIRVLPFMESRKHLTGPLIGIDRHISPGFNSKFVLRVAALFKSSFSFVHTSNSLRYDDVQHGTL